MRLKNGLKNYLDLGVSDKNPGWHLNTEQSRRILVAALKVFGVLKKMN
jgi:hypothetical protein